MKPKRNDDRAEMAAVAVIRSRLMSVSRVSALYWLLAANIPDAVLLTQQTEVVRLVGHTSDIVGIIAHACASGICENGCID